MAYRALHDPALSSSLPSFTVTFPPEALDSLLLLQQEQPVSTPGPLHMLLPLPGSFFHSIQCHSSERPSMTTEMKQ